MDNTWLLIRVWIASSLMIAGTCIGLRMILEHL